MSSHNKVSSSQEYIALKEELRRKNEEIRQLKDSNAQSIRVLERRIKELEAERDVLKDRLKTLERELEIVNEKVDHLSSLPLTPATAGEAYLYLAALCDGLQDMMYKHVFSATSDPDLTYKVKDIEADVSKEGTKARKKWEALQIRLNWDGARHLDAIMHCKRIRNRYAHPKAELTEQSLTKSIELLKSEGRLKGRLSLDVVQELKRMWKTLKG